MLNFLYAGIISMFFIFCNPRFYFETQITKNLCEEFVQINLFYSFIIFFFLDMDEDSELKLFAMLMEVCKDENAELESYIFLFDINQWYRSQMPSSIDHLKVSNSYASFVKLPNNVSYLDFNISDKTLRPFSYNFRNNVEELYYPSSIYFGKLFIWLTNIYT